MKETDIIEALRDERRRESAFRIVVDTYGERLYWQIRRIVVTHEDANDVLQNTFIKAWTALDNFRADAKMSTWLYRIACNEALSHLERQRTTLSIHDTNLCLQLQQDSYFDGDQTQLRLQEAIATLPDKQRLVFNLKYYDEMKYEDMSQILGTSTGALKASYHHAVKKISQFFKQFD